MANSGIDALIKQKAELIVTVDCGSTSVAEIDYANSKGIDVIVTDHHSVPDILPNAVAVINPKRKDNEYPFDDLAGVGVAFKLVQALQQKLDGFEPGQEKWLLDLVAFGTVCDVVKLTNENREFVYWGTEVIKRSRRVGLQALANSSGAPLKDVTATTFGFVFGPRLNAAGRLETAQHSLDLLLSTKREQANLLAEQLEDLNNARREEQAVIFEEADKQASQKTDMSVLVLSSAGWAEGIIGIVASKIMEKYKKPTFMIAKLKGDTAKGSARSFGDFSIVDAIKENKKLLVKGGGHKYAGGLTISPEKIDNFEQGLNSYYQSLKLSNQTEYLLAKPDISLDSLNPITLSLFDAIQTMAPFGMGNPEPVFELTDVKLSSRRTVGSDNQHLKVEFSDGMTRIEGIGFGMGARPVEVGQTLSPLVKIKKNSFNGNTTVQVHLVKI